MVKTTLRGGYFKQRNYPGYCFPTPVLKSSPHWVNSISALFFFSFQISSGEKEFWGRILPTVFLCFLVPCGQLSEMELEVQVPRTKKCLFKLFTMPTMQIYNKTNRKKDILKKSSIPSSDHQKNKYI